MSGFVLTIASTSKTSETLLREDSVKHISHQTQVISAAPVLQ